VEAIVADWIDELKRRLLFGPNDPVFPRTKLGLNNDKFFCVTGIEKTHWSVASPDRAIFRQAFEGAGPPYFPPHLRYSLGCALAA